MKIALVFPSPKSEKAISTISLNLVKCLREKSLLVDPLVYSAGNPLSFFKLFKKMRYYDIIHVQHEYNLLGFYGLPFFLIFFLLGFINKKIVISMHTAFSKREKFNESRLKSFLRKLLYISQNKSISLIADLILVNEDFYKKILSEDYNINPKRIKVIPQPLVNKPLLISKAKAKKDLGLKGYVYLIIGNLTEDVGADIIIRQADKIGKTIVFATNPKGVNVRSKIKTEEYINLNKKIVEDNKFEEFVRFDLKDIPNDLWWKYFSAADLILQAYRGGVRSGVFSDAMAARIPVIASNIPFFREMAKKYGSLKIAEKNEEYPLLIKKALKPSEYNKMKKECERYSRENGISNISEQYKKLYKALIRELESR